jgi:integrase
LNEAERRQFLAVADRARSNVRALCYVLAFTGCRVSEALELTTDQLDTAAKTLRFRTLKRRHLCFRSVPIPAELCEMLSALRVRQGDRYWTMHRVTAWRQVKRILAEIEVQGPMACCRGLRHGFGIRAAVRSVPPNLIQRWMGHAYATTTSVYLDAVGVEERLFAERMWEVRSMEPFPIKEGEHH